MNAMEKIEAEMRVAARSHVDAILSARKARYFANREAELAMLRSRFGWGDSCPADQMIRLAAERLSKARDQSRRRTAIYSGTEHADLNLFLLLEAEYQKRNAA